VRRNQQYFISKNAERLEQEINLHVKVIAKPNATDYEMPCTSGTFDRRKLAFEGSSERSKRRKSKQLRQTAGLPELTHATKMSLRSTGKTDATKVFIEAFERAPTKALRITKAWTAHAKNIVVLYTLEEALSLFIEAHLTKSQYTTIRSQVKMKNCNIYPSYHIIKAAKEECYPPKDKILIQESLVELDLQVLLDKTASRIIMAQKNVIDIVLDDTSKEFVLISKWGCH
jgi:hypothetical protein